MTEFFIGLVVATFLVILSLPGTSIAAEADGFKDRVCPDGWADRSDEIPVVGSSGIPWGSGGQDESMARANLLANDPVVETVDSVPVTIDDLVSDSLTVASECLKYRNMVVDDADYFPPAPPVVAKPENGWIPATYQ
ncbi:MAG: hypothetical protein AAF431_01150 [Pseudomonadota bacterium]